MQTLYQCSVALLLVWLACALVTFCCFIKGFGVSIIAQTVRELAEENPRCRLSVIWIAAVLVFLAGWPLVAKVNRDMRHFRCRNIARSFGRSRLPYR